MAILADNFGKLLDSILDIPEKLKELLVTLFVPTYSPVEEIKSIIDEKFSFVSDCSDMLKQAMQDSQSDIPPAFTITYKGKTLNIIDFTAFAKYRNYIHAIIIALFWFRFLLWLIKQIRIIVQPQGGVSE